MGGPGLSSDLIIGDDASASSAWLPCVVSVGFCQVGEGWGRGEQKNTEIKEHNNTFLIIYYNQRETDPHKTCENNMSGEHNNPESLCFSNYFHLRIFVSTRTSTEKEAFDFQHGFVIIYKNVFSQCALCFMENDRARLYYIRK